VVGGSAADAVMLGWGEQVCVRNARFSPLAVPEDDAIAYERSARLPGPAGRLGFSCSRVLDSRRGVRDVTAFRRGGRDRRR
jgi:hypothetical protein